MFTIHKTAIGEITIRQIGTNQRAIILSSVNPSALTNNPKGPLIKTGRALGDKEHKLYDTLTSPDVSYDDILHAWEATSKVQCRDIAVASSGEKVFSQDT